MIESERRDESSFDRISPLNTDCLDRYKLGRALAAINSDANRGVERC